MLKEEKKPDKETDLKSEIKRAKETSETSPEVKPEEKEGKKEFKPRYPHLWDGDINSYNQRLEEAYATSSSEGQKLHENLTKAEQEKEIIAKIVQSDPELKNKFAEKLYDGGYKEPILDETGNINKSAMSEIVKMAIREELPNLLQQDPALKSLKDEKEQKGREALEKFGAAHPEITKNPQLQDDLEIAFGVVAQTAIKKGQKLTFEEILNKSWEMVSGEKFEDLKDKTKVAQKENASMSSSSSEPIKSSSKEELTEAEKGIAEKLGLSEKDYLAGKKL